MLETGRLRLELVDVLFCVVVIIDFVRALVTRYGSMSTGGTVKRTTLGHFNNFVTNFDRHFISGVRIKDDLGFTGIVKDMLFQQFKISEWTVK